MRRGLKGFEMILTMSVFLCTSIIVLPIHAFAKHIIVQRDHKCDLQKVETLQGIYLSDKSMNCSYIERNKTPWSKKGQSIYIDNNLAFLTPGFFAFEISVNQDFVKLEDPNVNRIYETTRYQTASHQVTLQFVLPLRYIDHIAVYFTLEDHSQRMRGVYLIEKDHSNTITEQQRTEIKAVIASIIHD